MAGHVSQEFGRKYPFIKTNVWRSDSKELLKRLTDEAAAGRFIADVVETSPDYMALLIAANMFQEVFSPELASLRQQCQSQRKKRRVPLDQP